MGKEPEREALVSSTETTEPCRLQATPVQLQGVASRSDQEESEPAGSARESFTLCR